MGERAWGASIPLPLPWGAARVTVRVTAAPAQRDHLIALYEAAAREISDEAEDRVRALSESFAAGLAGGGGGGGGGARDGALSAEDSV